MLSYLFSLRALKVNLSIRAQVLKGDADEHFKQVIEMVFGLVRQR